MTETNPYKPRKRKTMADTFKTPEKTTKPKVNTSVWIDQDIHRQLKVRAAIDNTTISALIEESIMRLLKENQ